MGSSHTAPVIAAPDDGVALWLLKRRHEDLGTMFRAVWDNYIKFYTVFLTFSVTALGWLLSHTGADAPPVKIDHVVSVVFIVQSVLTSITSGALAVYSRRVAREYAQLEKTLLGTTPVPPALIGIETIPVKLAMWAGWANAAAMLGMASAWRYVGFPNLPALAK
jgi:hypothetical protein